MSEEQLAKKIRGESANSPFIYGQSWTSGTAPGNPANLTLYARNPDPSGYFPVYATMFFGLGNFLDAGQAWIGRDKRWPEFSTDRSFFLANSNQNFVFNYIIPTGLPLGTYNGNWVLWKGEWHDLGIGFDRGSFDLKLS